jgi:PAS domain-containing protein
MIVALNNFVSYIN